MSFSVSILKLIYKLFCPYLDTCMPFHSIIFRCICYIDISDVKYIGERSVYGILDLLSDVGGLLGIISPFISIFLGPYSELTFNLKIIHKLYQDTPSSCSGILTCSNKLIHLLKNSLPLPSIIFNCC